MLGLYVFGYFREHIHEKIPAVIYKNRMGI